MVLKRGKGNSHKSRKRKRFKDEINEDFNFEDNFRIVGEPDFNEVFEVEKIIMARYKLNCKRKKNRKDENLDDFEFYIKWKNYDSDENTWEPFENLSPNLKGQARKVALQLTEEIDNCNKNKNEKNDNEGENIEETVVGDNINRYIEGNIINNMENNSQQNVEQYNNKVYEQTRLVQNTDVLNPNKNKMGFIEIKPNDIDDDDEEIINIMRELEAENMKKEKNKLRNRNFSLFNMSSNSRLSNEINSYLYENSHKMDVTYIGKKKLEI